MANREIKFRALIPDVGIRVVHNFENETDTKRPARLSYRDHPSERAAKIKGYVTTTMLEGCILMQFTGMLDRYKVEVYEGDIVEIYDRETDTTHNSTVVRDRYAFWTLSHTEHMFEQMELMAYVYKVIGNIHENPELLQS